MKQPRYLVVLTLAVLTLAVLVPAATAQPVASSAVTDDAGDSRTINSLEPDFVTPGVVSQSGSTLTATVPLEVLASPTSFDWWATSWNGIGSSPVNYDFAPSFGTLTWSTGNLAETDDPVDGGLLPHQDIQHVSVSESGADMVFSVTLGSSTLEGTDRVQLSMDTSTGPSAFINIATDGTSPFAFANATTFWGGAWAWTAAPYADILDASIDGIGTSQVTFHARLAANVVPPQVEEGQPYFRWWLENGGELYGALLVWDRDLNDWVAKVFDWDAGAMQVVGPAISHQVVGSEVWVTVASADLPFLATGYEWNLFTGIMIGDVPASGPALVWYRWADATAPVSPIFTDGFESGNLSAWTSAVQ